MWIDINNEQGLFVIGCQQSTATVKFSHSYIAFEIIFQFKLTIFQMFFYRRPGPEGYPGEKGEKGHSGAIGLPGQKGVQGNWVAFILNVKKHRFNELFFVYCIGFPGAPGPEGPRGEWLSF